ncbi:MAG: hypothetical protein HYV09_27265 [Deltaproteobacteria bacterium]|nr:hypothetical protein [Deltaproteobacteria bacterium]
MIDDPRVITLERWDARAFHVMPCPFRVDLPLDMSGCIASALHDAMRAGHRRVPRGQILASDRDPNAVGAARSRREGAIFVEVEPSEDRALAWIEGDVLVRALPARATPLRPEVTELLRWSEELGHDVDGFYVGFVAGEGPRAFRPARLLAALDGGPVVETFEVRTPRRTFAQHA